MEAQPVTTLQQAITGLGVGIIRDGAHAVFSHLSAGELLEAVSLVEQLGRLTDTLRVEVAREVDARTLKRPENPEDSLAHSYGFGSAVDLLKQVTLAPGSVLTRRVLVGKACAPTLSLQGEELPGKFPHIHTAFMQGLISLDTADMLVSRFLKLSPSVPVERVEYVEQLVVSHATGIPLNDSAFEVLEGGVPQGSAGHPLHGDDLRQYTDMWLTVLDQEGDKPRDLQAERRYFRIGKERDGLVPISGAIVPEIAASLGRVIDAITTPRTSKGTDNADTTGATGTSTDPNAYSRVRFTPIGDDADTDLPRDTRTPDQKRHDVFATIITTAMKHDTMPHLGGEAVNLTIQVTETDLTHPNGVAWIHDATGALTPIDATGARHAACTGAVTRVTQDKAGRITGIETHERIFNARQRKAIMLRDGGCIIPGCGQNPYWCEIHHVTEWQQGGKTTTDNGVLLCWQHHRYLETNGWEIRMVDGVPEVKAPAWIDPENRWRPPRTVHKPPAPPEHWNTSPARQQPVPSRSRVSSCEATPATRAIPEPVSTPMSARPRKHAKRAHPVPDLSWATPHLTVMLEY